MPPRLRGNEYSANPGPKGVLRDAPDFEYTYPRDLDLKPGSDMHDRLLNAILDRIHNSFQSLHTRYPKWRDLDKTLTSYIRIDEAERQEQAKDERVPLSIVVPTSYAALETIMTYLVQAFLDRPIFRYQGVGPEDVLGAMLMELLVERQAHRGQMGMALHTMFRSSLVYGLGPITPVWKVTDGYASRPASGEVVPGLENSSVEG